MEEKGQTFVRKIYGRSSTQGTNDHTCQGGEKVHSEDCKSDHFTQLWRVINLKKKP